MSLRSCARRLSDVRMQKARSKKLESVNRKVKIRSMPIYRRPKFLEVLHGIREEMSREADYDVDLFAELVRYDRAAALDPDRLRERSRELLRKHLEWRPRGSPIAKFRERFERDLPELSRQGMGAYHAWVFGTVRQLGAASELAGLYLQWLEGAQVSEFAQPFLDISTVCKSLVLKVARAVNSKRPLDAGASFEQLSSAWELGSRMLREIT